MHVLDIMCIDIVPMKYSTVFLNILGPNGALRQPPNRNMHQEGVSIWLCSAVQLLKGKSTGITLIRIYYHQDLPSAREWVCFSLAKYQYMKKIMMLNCCVKAAGLPAPPSDQLAQIGNILILWSTYNLCIVGWILVSCSAGMRNK